MEAERSPQVSKWWMNLQDAVKEWEKTQDVLIGKIEPILSSPRMEEKALSESQPQGTENFCPFAADLCRVTEEILTAKKRASEVLKRLEI
jgi:hypothetical protein